LKFLFALITVKPTDLCQY